MIYSAEVQHMCSVAKGAYHGPAPIPEEVQLLTGRKHQIRVQLSAIGCPIKGDLKYGDRRSNPDGSISLLAHSIDFIHPVSKKHIHVTAPVPDDKLWKALASHAASDNNVSGTSVSDNDL